MPVEPVEPVALAGVLLVETAEQPASRTVTPMTPANAPCRPALDAVAMVVQTPPPAARFR